MTTLSEIDFPEAPEFSEEEIARCRASGQWEPIFFEWYKFVGSLATIVAEIRRDSPAFRKISDVHFHVLIGLLIRCARLMLANVALSHKGTFGETTAIIDRCIFETATKIIWLCTDPSDEKFDRYLSDSLRPELELKSQIEQNIEARNNSTLKIEARMLRSIANSISAARTSEDKILKTKRLPDLSQMLAAIGLNRLAYVAMQRMGSHHIHGTWPSLLFHYLVEQEDGTFAPRDHDVPTHVNQFVYIPLFVLSAMSAYISYVLDGTEEGNAFRQLFESVEAKILEINSEAIGEDFMSVDGS